MPEATNPPAATKQTKTRRKSGKPSPKNPDAKELPEEAKDTEPEADLPMSQEGGKQQEAKRPNRRRRGKGKPQGKQSPEIPQASEQGEVKDQPPVQGAPNAQRPEQKPRRKADPDKVAKNAWKIYLAEVSEEGVALIGDNDARELARRCFRLAELFIEEEDRRS